MIIERHYDDDLLIGLLEKGEAPSGDPHLKSCRRCREAFETFRAVAACLGEEAVWDLRDMREEPDEKSLAGLRGFADRLAREDAEGARLLEQLLAQPRSRWAAAAGNARYRNAGFVRKLVELCDEGDRPPADTLELTALATTLAEALDPAGLPGDAGTALRGAAWRERAYALYYVGALDEALEAAANARRCFESCQVGEYDLARVDVTVALVYREQDRIEEALRLVENAAAVFARFGDDRRTAAALQAKAYVLAQALDFEGALSTIDHILKNLSSGLSPRERTSLISNLGSYAAQLGRYEQAIEAFRAATAMYAELGIPVEVARQRWNVARILRQTNPSLAVREMEAALAEFERLGVQGAAATLALDLAELRLEEGRLDEVTKLCHSAMNQFRRSSLIYTSRALTALAYLKEAAEAGAISRNTVQHVRNYLETLPREPARPFAPPPAL
ncbi:MAG TPA: hypothetical protein VNL91_07030 [Thermoanaerobaculia bacterium]|nr:hypothetical protein [Thermoanaerobaculia bacterium]